MQESKTEKQVLVPTCAMYIQICLIILIIVKRNHQNGNELKCHLILLSLISHHLHLLWH